VGIGTLAPWNPPENLVVTGLYSHVRNPMLIGVICILLGETFLAQSGNILIWTTLLFVLINIGFVLKEEPDLVDRFGEEYEEYRRYVPRWIPRLKGWSPEKQSTNQLYAKKQCLRISKNPMSRSVVHSQDS
nr:isoprenylcysteine carboxylmethyltransferase family protein [Candidatus Poribacteria bacterium]